MNALLEASDTGSRPSQVDLWLLDPDQINALAPLALDFLTREEWDSGLRLREEHDRRFWAGRQAALRLVLGLYLGADPEDVRLRRDVRGKPEIDGRLGLRFSVSACEGWWLAAFSNQDVGVDLELVRPIPDIDVVAMRNFSECEWADLRAESNEVRRLNLFYRIWTRKEAVLKMLGLGLAGLPSLRMGSASSAWLEELNLHEGLKASLALVRPPTWIRRRAWTDFGCSTPMTSKSIQEEPRETIGYDGLSFAVETDMLSESYGASPSNVHSISKIGTKELERLERQSFLWLHMELPAILETIPQFGRFVDLGCGTGLQVDAIAAACPDVQVYGVDSDPLAVEHCRKQFAHRSSLQFEHRKIEQGPPVGSPLFDVAMMRLVLMHLPNPTAVLGAACAWLKPGGVLHVFESDDRCIVLEPSPEWMPRLLKMMQDVQLRLGGNRHLGEVLPDIMTAAGWNITGKRQFALDPQVAAAAIPKVFLPVAEYYLSEAERLGIGGPEERTSLKRGLADVTKGAVLFQKATIPIFHVWARSSIGASV